MVFYVVTGRRGEGKTFLAEKLAHQLKEEGLRVKGLITQGQEEKTFVDIATNQQEVLWREGDKLEVEIGQFKFSRRAMEFARNSIEEIEKADVVIIDEIAWLESEKRGLYQGIQKYLEKEIAEIIILVVRHQIVEKISDLFGIKLSRIWSIQKENREKALEEIKEICLQNS